jgi:hypothetical protein
VMNNLDDVYIYMLLLYRKYLQFIRISLIIIFLDIIFFIRTILFDRVPSAADLLTSWPLFNNENIQIQNWLLSDIVVAMEPWLWFNYFNIQHMQLPLWNPFCAGGVPHMANPGTAVFFFLTWPIYIFGISKYTLLIYYFIKMYLIGVTTYYYLKSISLSHISALVGAISVMFMNFVVVWLYYTPSNEIFILPLLLYFVEKIIEIKPNTKYLLGLAVTYAIGIFAGHAETFFHIVVISFVYFIFRLFSRHLSMAEKFKIFKGYMQYSILSIGLCSIQLIPTIEYLFFNSFALTTRSGNNYMLDWHTMILNLVPEFYGSPSHYYHFPYIIPTTNYIESASGYVGVSMICLAFYAIAMAYKKKIMIFYVALTLWAIGVIYGIPYIFDITILVPIFSQTDNIRLLFLTGFSTIVMGSIGLNEILNCSDDSQKKRSMRFFFIASVATLLILLILARLNQPFLSQLLCLNEQIRFFQTVLILLTILFIFFTLILIYFILICTHNSRLRRFAIISLILVVFAENGVHGILFNSAIDEKYFYPNHVEVFEWINEQNNYYRTTSIGSLGSVYPVNTQMMYGIYDIRDYDATELKYYWTLLNSFANGRIYGWVDLFNVDKRFLDFMGVKWVLSRDNLSKEMEISTVGGNATVGNFSVVRQDFLSRKANLTEIELLFDLQGNDKMNSNVSIELVETKTKNVVRSTRISTKILNTGQWYPFEFCPLNNSSNQRYTLRIETDAKTENGITLWRNSRSMISPESKLYINGIEVSGNLCFNTYTKRDNPFELIKTYQKFYLYQNREAMYRAFIVQEALFRGNDSEILSLLKNSSFNWKNAVVIFGKNNSIKYPDANSSININEYGPTHIKIHVTTNQPGFLMLTDTYYPGWNAYVNGTHEVIFRANYAFRAIKITPGTHIVEFKYEPTSVYLGGVISLFSLLIFITILQSKR